MSSHSNRVILKFGGTSMGSAESLPRVVHAIAKAQRSFEQIVVVCSACSGITASLREIADAAERTTSVDIAGMIEAIESRHITIAQELFASQEEYLQTTISQLQNLLSELRTYCEGVYLLRECTSESRAHIMGFGERFSTVLLNELLRSSSFASVRIDARTFVKAYGEPQLAIANIEETRQAANSVVSPLLEQGNVVVTQGFIAANALHKTVLLGIGGSDVSAAVVGAALNAQEIQIWTDVSGIYSTDPRVVSDAQPVAEMTYEEAGELAYFGAKVLHPDTIHPAVELGIPVRILNTFAPEELGTTLLPREKITSSGLRAVALRRGCTLVHCTLKPNSAKMEFMSTLYSVLEEAGIEVLLSQGTERHHTVCVASTDVVRLPSQRLMRLTNISTEDVALLCACGPDLSKPECNPIGSITMSLSEYGLHTVQQSSDNISIVAAVPESQAVEALRSIHKLID